MKSIEEQIEALTQELHPQAFDFDKGVKEETRMKLSRLAFDSAIRCLANYSGFTNEEEEDGYADCYKRLRLYQLLGKEAEKEFPIDWAILSNSYIGTDFTQSTDGAVYSTALSTESQKYCVLGGVWFSREEDRLEALKICGIDRSFQEKCSRYGLGGA